MAVVPVSHDFVDGLATSSEMNSYVRDPIAFMMNPPRAELRQITTGQSFTTLTITAVTWNAADFDTDVDGIGGHDVAINNTRFTARYPGTYLLGGVVQFSPNASGARFAWLRLNGVDVDASSGSSVPSAADGSPTAARVKKVYMNVGDYVELMAFQTSGSTLTGLVGGRDQSSFSILWVSN